MSPRPARPPKVIEEIDVPSYRGPDRRSGAHSPYGDELFRMMRQFTRRQEAMLRSIEDLIVAVGVDSKDEQP